ncbi:hypothetical protein Plhal710r2_c035g0126931 [Plasmopara halstedii]
MYRGVLRFLLGSEMTKFTFKDSKNIMLSGKWTNVLLEVLVFYVRHGERYPLFPLVRKRKLANKSWRSPSARGNKRVNEKADASTLRTNEQLSIEVFASSYPNLVRSKHQSLQPSRAKTDSDDAEKLGLCRRDDSDSYIISIDYQHFAGAMVCGLTAIDTPSTTKMEKVTSTQYVRISSV